MVIIDTTRCTGCKICVRECPVQALKLQDGVAVAGDACVRCGLCVGLCPREAMSDAPTPGAGTVCCNNCPVGCRIASGYRGACHRYSNTAGRLELTKPLVVPAHWGPRREIVLDPLITGVGAGTTAPCFIPAPYVVEDTIDGIDVVTVVSEVPLSYSGIKLKVDTNVFLGEEGARIRRDGRAIGHMETEEYGSKMIAIGGVNTLHGEFGSTAARTMSDLCNFRTIELKVERGSRMSVQVGSSPVVDGLIPDPMRVGCGSATSAMFAPVLKAVADETIVLDPHITGLLSEHAAGRSLGMTWSGVTPIGRKSTAGRYFGTAGAGLGGTNVTRPIDAVAGVDADVARVGMTLFIVDTAGRSGFIFRLRHDGEWDELAMSAEGHTAMAAIRDCAQPSRVSAILVAGVGGSARAGVTRSPVKLNEAVHDGRVRLTMGGADVWVYPGGGITFAVDVEQVPLGAFTWVPTPALVAPVEYTMTRQVYELMDGHMDALRPRADVLAERATLAIDQIRHEERQTSQDTR